MSRTVVALALLAVVFVVAVEVRRRSISASSAQGVVVLPDAGIGLTPAPQPRTAPPTENASLGPLAPPLPRDWSAPDALRVYGYGRYWLVMTSAGLPLDRERAFLESMSAACARTTADELAQTLLLATSPLDMLGQRDQRLTAELVALADAGQLEGREAMRRALAARQALLSLARSAAPSTITTGKPASEIQELVATDVAKATCTERAGGMDCFFAGEREGLRVAPEDGVWRVRCDEKPLRDVRVAEPCGPPEPPPACLITALDELEACGRPEPASGRWVHREFNLDHVVCAHPSGDTADAQDDSRLGGRRRLTVSLSRGGKPCASLDHFVLSPLVRPLHALNRSDRLEQTTLATKSGTVTLRIPGRVGALADDGTCVSGCMQTVTCPDGKVHESRACEHWRVLRSWGAGPRFQLAREGREEAFWTCDTPNTLEAFTPPTLPDTSNDPAPPHE